MDLAGAGMAAGFAVLFLIGVWLIGALLLVVPTWKVCSRAGYAGALALFHFLPVVGSLIVLAILAFGTWPAGEARRRGG